MRAVRTLALWCPDWPVIAALLVGDVPEGRPAAVLRANRVVSASAEARADGVRRGMRRREAQSRCPDVELVTDDPGRDARAFEPVVAAVEGFTPLVEIVRPGLLQFATRGPSRYFGGDEALAARVLAAVDTVLGGLDVGARGQEGVGAPVARVGIADGPFAAAVAARLVRPVPRGDDARPTGRPTEGGDNDAAASAVLGKRAGAHSPGARAVTAGGGGDAAASSAQVAVHVVPPGGSPGFLAPLPVSALVGVHADQGTGGRARVGLSRRGAAATELDALRDLAELMARLGVATLGQLAALPATDVLARFGPVGVRAQHLAAGLDPDAPRARVPPPDLQVTSELDPPVDRVDVAAFVARGLAEELHERLARSGLACACIRIEARFEDGTELVRRWRHERAGAAGGLTPAGLADRVRWQLDGWLLARQRQIQQVRRSRAGGGSRAGAGAGAGAADTSHGPVGGDRSGPMDHPDPVGGVTPRSPVPARTTAAPQHHDAAEPAEVPGSAITMVRLVPDEVVPDEGRQLGLWGTASAADERAARAFTRVQGLLGPEAVCTVVPAGGRHPGALAAFVPWGDKRERPAAADAPWPGRVPSPLPTVVHDPVLPVVVTGPSGESVSVSGRGLPSEAPMLLRVGSSERTVTAWAGPWPVDERWWDVQEHRRKARFQIRTDDGGAHLVVLESGAWWLEASYE